jgi:hypothetical protein
VKFKTHNDKKINTNGTSLAGEIYASFEQLLAKFGTPLGQSPDNKVDVEWHVEIPGHESPFTIYNWKDGVAYLGKDGKNPADIDVWHIGASEDGKFLAAEVIQIILDEK